MSAVTQPAVARASHLDVSHRGLGAAGIVRSEWIKLRSLRSTWWSFGLIVIIQVGIATVFALTVTPVSGDVPTDAVTDSAVSITTLGVQFGQLVIGVLGVLVISGEYSTGQIRSSFMAVPSRLPVLAAKSLVFAAATFVVALAGIVLSYLVTMPILSAAGIDPHPADPNLWLRMTAAAGYLVFIGLVSLGIGAALRSTAGGIAASLGLLLVIPTIFQIIPAGWANSFADWLPGVVGPNMFYPGGAFEPWQALLVMLGWVTVALAAAAVLMKRRDA